MHYTKVLARFASNPNLTITVKFEVEEEGSDAESEKSVGYLSLEDGTFVNGNWITGRRLNGDESRVTFPADRSKIYKLSLYSY